MARLLTAGFESGIPAASPYGGERDGAVESRQTNTTTYQSSVARNGGRALQCSPSAANYEQITGLTHTVDVPTYARFYFRFNAAPTETLQVWAWRLNATVVATLDLLTTRAIRLNVPASGSAGSSSALSVDTWYLIETSITIPASGNGSVELRIDGVTAVGPSAGNVGTTLTPSTHRIGHVTGTETATTLYFDDLAINDGSGGSQNSWPGAGNVSLLLPTADNAKGTGWEAPQTTGSDTTDIYQAVDNVPPVGVAHSDADANNGAYIFNAANLGAASDYRATCQTPNAILPAGAPIMLSQAYMRASCNSTTGTNNMELQGITPSDSAVTCNVEQTAVAGTEPTGWKSFRTAVTYRPSLALTDAPVVEATKILTGAARVHMVDQMGLLIEWRTPVEGSAALGATGAITSAGEFETPSGATVERSASLSATAAIDSAATFYTIFTRSATLDVTGAVTVGQQRDLLRAASLAATAAIAIDSERDLLRSASFGATGAITSSAIRVHVRSASVSATASTTTGHQRELLRSAAAEATASITASGEIEGGIVSHERSAAIGSTVTITTSSYPIRIRSAALGATGAVTAAGQFFSVLERSAGFDGAGALSASAYVVHVRLAAIGATGLIDGSGQLITSRSAALGALAEIAASAGGEHPGWVLDTGEPWPATEGGEWPQGTQQAWPALAGAQWSQNNGEEW